MTAYPFLKIPDIESPAHDDAPKVFGRAPAAFDDATLNVIRINADKMSADELAKVLRWPLKVLKQIARRHSIPLDLPKEPDPVGA